MPSLTRRQLLLGLAATPFAYTLACTAQARPAPPTTRPLPIPPLAESTVGADGTRHFTLRAMTGESDMVRGLRTPTWGFNGTVLGPTLRARRGESVSVTVENRLPEPTTVHWHGMHVPARCDGGPHQPISPGGDWTPSWIVKQPAATLWYHPHPHGATEKHVYRGLAGLFIVDDERGDRLPVDYGVDDIPLIIQDRRFTTTGALDESDPSDIGLLGDTIITNGAAQAHLRVTTQRVRFRILNGSSGRLYNLGFEDDREFHVVGTDGGLLAEPVAVTRIQLSPAERVEIVVGVRPTERTLLRSFPIAGRAGLAAEEASRFGVGDTFDILRLDAADTLRPNASLPATLTTLPALPAVARTERSFDLQWFMINRNRMDMNRIDFRAEVDTDEIWTIRNVDNWPHNFHVHDTQFRIIDIDGNPPPPELAGFKDTVYTAPGQRIRIAVRFADYTDPTFTYMYHCHLTMHEDQGMMGQFLVLGAGEQAPVTAPAHDHSMR